MNERERDIKEPQTEQAGQYEAQASSAAPTRERDARTQPAEDGESIDERERTMQAVDQRAATTKTEPMGRLGGSTLIEQDRLGYFAGQWDQIQAGFVDDPRRTVERADRLVAEVIDQLSTMFKEERSRLEAQWSKGGQADTEDLRKTMQRYHEFFQTLVGR